jgi:hypothetical protein
MFNPAYPVPNRFGRPGFCTDKINVFRIAQGLGKVQLVKSRAAPKSQFFVQEGIAEEFYQRTGNDEVLLHLPRLGPRSYLTTTR